MTTLLTLTTAGANTGPFDLYSNLDVFAVPFATGISKATLQAGYLTTLVPDFTTIVRVQSQGVCVNYVDIPLYIKSYPYTVEVGDDCPTACGISSVTVFM